MCLTIYTSVIVTQLLDMQDSIFSFEPASSIRGPFSGSVFFSSKATFFKMASALTRGKRLVRLSLGLETDEGMNNLKIIDVTVACDWKIDRSSLRNAVDLIAETLYSNCNIKP